MAGRLLRLWIAIFVGGAVLIYYGVREARLASGASKDPVSVELSALEKGGALTDTHIVVGKHLRLFPAAIFSYQGTGEPQPHHSVDYTYYPVISPEHPFLVELARLEQKFGDLDKLPDDQWPELKSFRMLVKTTAFSTVGMIPGDIVPGERVQGLVINSVDSLDSEERGLLLQSFPGMNLDNVIIVEMGRKPSSAAGAGALVLLGVLLCASGVVIPLTIHKKEKQREVKANVAHRGRMSKAKEEVRAAMAKKAAAATVPAAAPAAEEEYVGEYDDDEEYEDNEDNEEYEDDEYEEEERR